MNIILCSEKDRAGDFFLFEKCDERYLHITKVLKLKKGDSFKAGLINDKLGIAQITKMSQEQIIFRFAPTETPIALHPLHLILGIPRPIQLKRLLKDVSTLGISSIHLVGTVLGEKSYITSSLIANDEIEQHLVEGASQAGSTLIPAHYIYSSLNKAFQQNEKLGNNQPSSENIIRILFDVEDAEMKGHEGCYRSLHYEEKNILHEKGKVESTLDSIFARDKQIILAIGSERGWARSERELFKKHNFTTVTLGKRIMRCETATIAAISYLLTKIGWNA